MASKLTNILCTYTGGGIYIYHAMLDGKVWISTDFESYGTYDVNPLIIEEELDCDYDSHWVDVNYPLPTWREILDSIKEHKGERNCMNLFYDEVEEICRYYNGDNLDDPINSEDLEGGHDDE